MGGGKAPLPSLPAYWILAKTEMGQNVRIMLFRGGCFRQLRAAGVLLALLAVWCAPAVARADLAAQTTLGLDIGPGSIITKYSTGSADSGGLLFVGLRGSYAWSDQLAGQLVLQQWWLPGANQAIMPGIGLRVSPIRVDLGSLFVDGSLGAAFTGHGTGFGYDIGGGFEFNVLDLPGLGLGPYFRYGEVVNPDSASDHDGRAWSVGVLASVRLGPAMTAYDARQREQQQKRHPVHGLDLKVPDSDNDGFTDDVDQCPNQPAGKHPDSLRPGCPEGDEDEDGVPDSIDACPLVPAGDKPDPKRRGCPADGGDK
jgi:hypothetical protein